MALCYQCFREKGAETVCPFCGYDPTGAADKYPLALRPGTILNGRYTVGRVLGQGGFGITYIAQEYRTGERVALKEYFPSEFAGRSQGLTVQVHSSQQLENYEYGKARFLEEAKTLAAFIGNENIVRIYSYFEENGTAYFAMEYVDGLPLDQYMARRGGRLSPAEANRLLLPLMAALETVHLKGIVHRDIAPDNIIIAKDGTAKLIDFGAARYSTGEKSKSLDVIIKHGFAPKEQYMRRGRQGPFTDIYALAASYYYAITGKVPPEAIERLDEDNLIPPRMLGIKLSSEAEDALFKALEVNAADRYQSMAEFYQAMKAASAPESEEERRERELREELARLEQKRKEREAREEAERQERARQERESRERERQEKLAREKAEREAKEKAEREARAEAERRRKEEKERQAREKAEKAEREKQEKARREALKKAERESARAARQTEHEARQSAGAKKSRLPLVLAAVLVLALVVFGVTRFTGKNTPAVTEAPTVTEVSPEPTPKPTPEPIPVHFKAIAAGYNHSVALLENGRVAAVGDNQAGQCDTDAWRDIIAIAAGKGHTVGLRANGTVVAAGNNASGQCELSGWTDIVAIAAGDGHTVGLKEDGTVVAAGLNNFGQCDVSSMRSIKAVSAGEVGTVGIQKNGTIVLVGQIGFNRGSGYFKFDDSKWRDVVFITTAYGKVFGLNANGEILPSDSLHFGTDITAVEIGENHVIGLRSDGTVPSYGNNAAGQCDTADWKNVVSIAAGGAFSLGLTQDGEILCAGDNTYGQCDMDALMDKARAAVEEEAANADKIVSIAASTFNTFVAYGDGTVAAVGSTFDSLKDWQGIQQIAAGYKHLVGLKKDGTVVASSAGYQGQNDVSSWEGIVSIAAAGYHTVGLKADGTVVATGDNKHGQCDVSSWRNVIAISASPCNTVGLCKDGSLLLAGDKNCGQRDILNWKEVIAVAPGGLYDPVQLYPKKPELNNMAHIAGILADGTLVAVGNNAYHQCDVSEWTNIVYLAANSSRTAGLRADGTVVCTGRGQYSADGTMKEYDGTPWGADWTDITAISLGSDYLVGLKSDGTVVAVGGPNTYGQCDVASLNRVSS